MTLTNVGTSSPSFNVSIIDVMWISYETYDTFTFKCICVLGKHSSWKSEASSLQVDVCLRTAGPDPADTRLFFHRHRSITETTRHVSWIHPNPSCWFTELKWDYRLFLSASSQVLDHHQQCQSEPKIQLSLPKNLKSKEVNYFSLYFHFPVGFSLGCTPQTSAGFQTRTECA